MSADLPSHNQFWVHPAFSKMATVANAIRRANFAGDFPEACPIFGIGAIESRP